MAAAPPLLWPLRTSCLISCLINLCHCSNASFVLGMTSPDGSATASALDIPEARQSFSQVAVDPSPKVLTVFKNVPYCRSQFVKVNQKRIPVMREAKTEPVKTTSGPTTTERVFFSQHRPSFSSPREHEPTVPSDKRDDWRANALKRLQPSEEQLSDTVQERIFGIPVPTIDYEAAEFDNGEENLGHAETYAEYVPSKLRSGLSHPDGVVESTSLRSVQPPNIKYHMIYPEELIDTGHISSLQLEAVIHAGQMHQNRVRSTKLPRRTLRRVLLHFLKRCPQSSTASDGPESPPPNETEKSAAMLPNSDCQM
uniref:AAA_34 domain-containing protein n=1 Tax=Steinernema glaseri TaxID=37863 RepID=A0A1I7Y3Y1_9BILA